MPRRGGETTCGLRLRNADGGGDAAGPVPMTTNRKATAYDVATLAGVSQSAVSRAFTQGASISAAKRRKVVEAAEALGYRPNLLARSLTTRRSNLVGLAAGNFENPLFTTYLDALSGRLSDAGLRLLMFTARVGAQVDAQIEEVLNYRVDALVLISTFMSDRLAAQCEAAGVTMVFVNRRPLDIGRACSITGENATGAAAVATHLLDQGYRRPAFMAGLADSLTSVERGAAFTGHLRSQGLPDPIREEGHFNRAGAMNAMRRLLSRPDRPDSVFCASDHMACAAIDVARAEFGLEPGRDIGIAGFDDVPIAAWPSYAITSYALPIDALADATLRLILNYDELSADERGVTIPGQLMVRASTRRR